MGRSLALGLILILVSSCSAKATRQAEVIPTVLPTLPAHIEPESLPIAVSLPRENRFDDVGLAIVEARMKFEHGEELYQTGFLQQAKQEFDSAMDTLLDSSAQYPRNDRILKEINDLVSRIHALELAAIRDGDGFSDHTQDHAAIDDLRNVPTFPSVIDPKLKDLAEEDINTFTHDLPIEINNRVLGFLEYYSNGRGRNTITVGLQRMALYRPMIERILKEEDVPLDLIFVAQAESAFLPRALSSAKAKGMWQFISSRGKEYGLRQTWWIDERSDPEKSTRAAARHLKDLYEQFGDWYLAMAGYNAGPMRVTRGMERTGGSSFWDLADKGVLPKETINYVPNVLALAIIGKSPEKYGFSIPSVEPLETDRVAVDQATDLRVIAESLSIPVEELRNLNPHVLRWTTPPDDSDFELILPKGYADKFNENVASLPESQRVLFRHHSVRRGETLSVIAKKYGTSVADLTQANNISVKKALQIGQSLLIPMSGVAPAATPVASKSTVPAGGAYTVRKGDTLSKIASQFGVSVNDLKSWNKLSSNQIAIGKKLRVGEAVVAAAAPEAPETRSVVHKVLRGETLGKIATAYKTTVDAILSWNNRNDLSVIHPGDRITILLGNED